jgi:hypothetical protein
MKIIAFLLLLNAAICLVGCSSASLDYHFAEANANAVPAAPVPQASAVTPPVQHLTAGQAIALAKPLLPLPPGEEYRARFIPDASKVYAPGTGRDRHEAIWWVYTDRDDVRYAGWTVVVIRDSDGKVLGFEDHA